MDSFKPISIDSDNVSLSFLEGQFITAAKPFYDEQNRRFSPGVYVDLEGQRQELTMKGEVGSIGPIGPEGKQGPTGPQGLQGQRGVTGPVGPQGAQGIQGPEGRQGPIGPQGQPGNVYKWYPSLAALMDDYNNPDIPLNALVAVNTEGDVDDGKLYYKGFSEWVYITQWQGVQGPTGPQGVQGVQGIQGPPGRDGTSSIVAAGNGLQLTNGSMSIKVDTSSFSGLTAGTNGLKLDLSTLNNALVLTPNSTGNEILAAFDDLRHNPLHPIKYLSGGVVRDIGAISAKEIFVTPWIDDNIIYSPVFTQGEEVVNWTHEVKTTTIGGTPAVNYTENAEGGKTAEIS